MGIEGVKAPVLGCDALSLRAFDFAVFTQSGQLERMGSALAKRNGSLPVSLSLSAGVQLTLFLLFLLCLRRGSQKGIPRHLGQCVGVDG